MHRIFAYVELALIFIIIICILYLPFLFILKKRGHRPIRQMVCLGFGCSVFLIIYAAFLFMPIEFQLGNHFSCNLIPLHFLIEEDSMRLFVTEKVPNIMLFIPLGLFLPLVFKSMRSGKKTMLCALALTCCIEFIQFFIGRSADIDDVITNFLGALIGYALYSAGNVLWQKTNFWQILLGNK